jgi:hypothetical protein
MASEPAGLDAELAPQPAGGADRAEGKRAESGIGKPGDARDNALHAIVGIGSSRPHVAPEGRHTHRHTCGHTGQEFSAVDRRHRAPPLPPYRVRQNAYPSRCLDEDTLALDVAASSGSACTGILSEEEKDPADSGCYDRAPNGRPRVYLVFLTRVCGSRRTPC